MKRPLSLIAVCFFVIQAFSLILPQQAYLPIAAIFSCVLLLSFKAIKKRGLFQISIILAAVSFAFIWRAGYQHFVVSPSIALIGTKSEISAEVNTVNPYNNGVMSATLTIKTADNKALNGKSVFIANIPSANAGDIVRLNVELPSLTPLHAGRYNPDGVFIAAKYIDGFEILQEKGVLSIFSNMKSALSTSFQSLTTETIGAIGAAMAFGDKGLLTADIKDGFRAAGLSHMLVVSGMHLAAFSGLIFALCGLFVRNRRIRAIVSVIFTLFFVLLTGITPSSIRAGVMLCIVYIGMCFWRQADTITSLCTALLILTMQNPFIVMDLGFLLSFAATAGIIGGNTYILYLKQKGFFKNKIIFKICRIISVPLSASLATAPILIAFGLGISVMGLIFNIIAVPLLAFIVALVFAASLLNFVPLFYFPAKFVAILASLLISAVNFIASTALILPFSVIYLKGMAAAFVLPLAVLLAYIGAKLRVKHLWLYIPLFAVLAFSFTALADINVVHISAVTSAQNAPLAIYKNGKASIVFRAKPKIDKYFIDFLKQNNIKSIELVALMGNFELDEAFEELKPETIISEEDFSFNTTSYIFDDIIIDMQKQENSCALFINIDGITLALNRGSYNFSDIDKINVYIAGQSRAENINADDIIVNNSIPKWLLQEGNSFTLSTNAEISVRPGISYKLNEGYYELN